MMNSYYGFGESLMKKYIGQFDRPYSPPLVDREAGDEGQEHGQDMGDK
jgi:hypothetical protein